MYPKPHCCTDCLIDLRALSYELLDASLEVKCMSSLFSPDVLPWLERNLRMVEPTSFSLRYIWAESKLKGSRAGLAVTSRHARLRSFVRSIASLKSMYQHPLERFLPASNLKCPLHRTAGLLSRSQVHTQVNAGHGQSIDELAGRPISNIPVFLTWFWYLYARS